MEPTVEIGDLEFILWGGEWMLWCGCGDVIPLPEVIHEHCINCHMVCEDSPVPEPVNQTKGYVDEQIPFGD